MYSFVHIQPVQHQPEVSGILLSDMHLHAGVLAAAFHVHFNLRSKKKNAVFRSTVVTQEESRNKPQLY